MMLRKQPRIVSKWALQLAHFPCIPHAIVGLCLLVIFQGADPMVSAFHLSFGQRLLKSIQHQNQQLDTSQAGAQLYHPINPNPQLNPASSMLRPIECRNANNQTETGICMFSIDCMQNKGVPLSICKHNYFVGTCCRLPNYNNFVGIVYDLRDTETQSVQLEARKAISLAANELATRRTTGNSELSPLSSESISSLDNANANANASSATQTQLSAGVALDQTTTLAHQSTKVAVTQSPQKPDHQQQHLRIHEKHNNSTDEESSRQQQQQFPNDANAAEKYVISSTSLFSGGRQQVGSTAAVADASSWSSSSPLPPPLAQAATTANNHQSPQPPPPPPPTTTTTTTRQHMPPTATTMMPSESARNADGGSGAAGLIGHNNQLAINWLTDDKVQQQKLAAIQPSGALIDSFQIQLAPNHHTTQVASQQQQATEDQQQQQQSQSKLIAQNASNHELVVSNSSSSDLGALGVVASGAGEVLSSAQSAPLASQPLPTGGGGELANSKQQVLVFAINDSDATKQQANGVIYHLAEPQQGTPTTQGATERPNDAQSSDAAGQDARGAQQEATGANSYASGEQVAPAMDGFALSVAPGPIRPGGGAPAPELAQTVALAPTTTTTTTANNNNNNNSSPTQEFQWSASTTTTRGIAASSPPVQSSDSHRHQSSTEAPATESSSRSSPQAANVVPQEAPEGQAVDLISSTINDKQQQQHQQQSTTPFTSSLSTASLPSVSSRPYSPTPAPMSPAHPALVPHQHNYATPSSTSAAAHQSPSASTLAAAAAVAAAAATTTTTTTTTTITVADSSKPLATETTQANAAELANFSQLYSSQHSPPPPPSTSSSVAPSVSAASNLKAPTGHRPPPANHQQMLPLLQAASSKIVAGPSTNHLIPGLGGLQSAILAHIPFKLANGLSSGLSSYLQAAMKPSGSRPLLSSNTAPNLQFQQHHNSQTSPSTTTTTTTEAHGGTSPAASATSGASASATPTPAVRFPAAGAGHLQAAAPHPLATDLRPPAGAQQAARDPMREAQLVCGRPQVASQQQAPEHYAIGGHNQTAKRRVGRIVGGNQSWFGQWPWMVSLRQWRKGAFLHKCGAALLNENWAITAAHCVENVKASDLLLRLGEFDVSKQDEPYPFVERRVKSVVAHPMFDPKTFEYDLALLRFAEPIPYERNIVPVCVPQGNDSYVDRMATVIGWGRLYEDGPLPDVIQHVDVPIITNHECEKMYKNAGYIEEIPDMFICAGINKGGRDSCEGDSGGPLTMVDHDGRSYLVGIISWGIGCALPSQPGVYTRITAFSGWINEMMT